MLYVAIHIAKLTVPLWLIRP